MLAPLYAPYVGGAETHTRALAEALVAQGQQVSVLTDRGHRRLPGTDTIGGVRVLRTDPGGSVLRTDPPGRRGGASRGRDAVRWEVGLFGLLADVERLIGTGSPRRPT
jgi:hypothetical protein